MFSLKGDLYLIFNDNQDDLQPSRQRRDMFVAKLSYANQKFSLSPPIKLMHEQDYIHRLCQKNWVPFVWNDKILLGYQIAPHEILEPNFSNGNCIRLHETATSTRWRWGEFEGRHAGTTRRWRIPGLFSLLHDYFF